ncbi:MAG TPA: LemA family protein [Saprospiraceae bacterium]|nr:LemA family protein [Saprospiraceae bacterium]HMP15152.1 LemA family protein [Saprospiraceae bacterium]
MRPLVTALVLISLGLIVFVGGCSNYNSFVTLDENVKQSWGQVQSAYQRRADLIPNLVNTVKGYANFEQQTLTQVVEARAKATSVQIDPSNITPEKLKEFQSAYGEMNSALSRLLVTVEKYPDLKANQNFLELQAQLEGTENRIKVERDNFNKAVTEYNKKVRQFPGTLFAGMFGFGQRAQFEAEANAQNAPKVEF